MNLIKHTQVIAHRRINKLNLLMKGGGVSVQPYVCVRVCVCVCVCGGQGSTWRLYHTMNMQGEKEKKKLKKNIYIKKTTPKNTQKKQTNKQTLESSLP